MVWYVWFVCMVCYGMLNSVSNLLVAAKPMRCDAMRCGAVRYSDEILYRAMPCHAMQMPTIRPTHLRTSRQASPVFFVCVKPSGYMHSSCFGVWRMAGCPRARWAFWCREEFVLALLVVTIGILSILKRLLVSNYY